jgi:mRNA interferase MazF
MRTGKLTVGFNVWDVIKVPFPYVDRPIRQRRPALVIAASDVLTRNRLLWVAMITSAENRGWDGDVEIPDFATAGLPSDSVVRAAKIACIDARDAERMGVLPKGAERRAVAAAMLQQLETLLAEAG